MPRASSNQIRYGAGTITPRPGDKFDCFLFIDATRHRARKSSLQEARQWIDMTEDATHANRDPLTALQLADAQRALAYLPEGHTLTEAAQQMAERAAPADITSPTLSTALAQFTADKAIEIEKTTLSNYTRQVEHLTERTGDAPVASITRAQVTDYLNHAAGGPVTRNNNIRNLAVFFNWCQTAYSLPHSPTTGIPKAKAPPPPKGVLSVKEAEKLLRAAEQIDTGLIPTITLALFAGIRPEEIMRLPTASIRKQYIIIDAKIAKSGEPRTIPIRPNLAAWLKRYPAHGPDILTEVKSIASYYRRIQKIRKKAKIQWHKGAMRHSFGTYGYELTKDAATMAADMGHKSTEVFFKHYRALATPGAGKKFFSIRPTPRK